MANKESRLLIEIFTQKAKNKDQILACALANEYLSISVKPVPTFKKILFKKVLVLDKDKCKTIKILKIKHRPK